VRTAGVEAGAQPSGLARLAALEKHCSDCVTHKNCTLIRYDIIECLRTVCDVVQNVGIKDRTLALITLETDPKHKKKDLTVWPGPRNSD
jgi:hypothetical protein